MTYFPWEFVDQEVKAALEDNCQAFLTGQIKPADFIERIDKSIDN
jgi:hypothetical protein